MSKFGGDTGIDADYLAVGDAWVCQDCEDDIEFEEEVKIEQSLYCPDCAEEIQRRDEKNGVYPDKWDDAN